MFYTLSRSIYVKNNLPQAVYKKIYISLHDMKHRYKH